MVCKGDAIFVRANQGLLLMRRECQTFSLWMIIPLILLFLSVAVKTVFITIIERWQFICLGFAAIMIAVVISGCSTVQIDQQHEPVWTECRIA